MCEEMIALRQNETWTLEELPKGQRTLGVNGYTAKRRIRMAILGGIRQGL